MHNRVFLNDPELAVTERTLQRWLSEFKNSGLVRIEILDNNQRQMQLTGAGLDSLPERVRGDRSWAGEGDHPRSRSGSPSTAGKGEKPRSPITPGKVRTNGTVQVQEREKVVPIRKEPETSWDDASQRLFAKISPSSVLAIVDAHQGEEGGAPVFEGLDTRLEQLVRTEYPGAVFLARSEVG